MPSTRKGCAPSFAPLSSSGAEFATASKELENKLEQVGTSLDKSLQNLTSLDLHGNKLESIDLSQLEKLQEVSLNNNNLKKTILLFLVESYLQ